MDELTCDLLGGQAAEAPFTAADVAALAELIRPHLSADWDLECAVALAEEKERADFERRIFNTDLLTAALSGTYDEFRAEKAA